MIARTRLPELRQRPLCRRVGSDVVTEDSPRARFHNHEYIKDAKAGRHNDEEVGRDDRFGMVMDERQPTLLRIGCPAHQSYPSS